MTSAEFNKEIEFLTNNTRTLEEHVKYLYNKNIETKIIYSMLCVYLREVLQKRLKTTPTKTYVEKICSAMLYPKDEIFQCLCAMNDDKRIDFSEDESYVIWKGPDYIPGIWNHEWASMRNKVDDVIVAILSGKK